MKKITTHKEIDKPGKYRFERSKEVMNMTVFQIFEGNCLLFTLNRGGGGGGGIFRDRALL